MQLAIQTKNVTCYRDRLTVARPIISVTSIENPAISMHGTVLAISANRCCHQEILNVPRSQTPNQECYSTFFTRMLNVIVSTSTPEYMPHFVHIPRYNTLPLNSRRILRAEDSA